MQLPPLLLALNITFIDGTSLCLTYQTRDGSLLASDLLLSFIRFVYSRGVCYKGKSLVTVQLPLVVISNLTKALLNSTETNVSISETELEWYELMLSTTHYKRLAEELGRCVKENHLVSDVCFTALKGLYYKAYFRPLVVVSLDGCLAVNLKYLNTSIPKDVILWTLSHYNLRRLEFQNRTELLYAISFLKSLYAYLIYYKPNESTFLKELYRSAVAGTCSWVQAVSIAIGKLVFGIDWWMYYPKLVKLFSSLPRSS